MSTFYRFDILHYFKKKKKRKKLVLKITVFIFYRLYLARNVVKFYREVKFIYDNFYIRTFQSNEKIVITVFLLHSYAQNNLTALKIEEKIIYLFNRKYTLHV